MLAVPVRVPVAETVHESGLVMGSVTFAVSGVVPVELLDVCAVWPASEQSAVQATEALWLEPCVTVRDRLTEPGLVMVCVWVQLAWAPDALQKPAVLAAAAVAPAAIATAVSNPVKAA
jgi:hypothetical protein